MSGLTGNSLHLLLCLLCYYDVLLLLVMSLYIVLPLLCIVLSWLCNHMDCCPPGSSVQEILQARILSGLPCPPPGDLPDIYIYVDICVCVCVCVCVCIYIYFRIYVYTHIYMYFKIFFGWSVWRKSSRIHICGWAKEEYFNKSFQKIVDQLIYQVLTGDSFLKVAMWDQAILVSFLYSVMVEFGNCSISE